MDKDLTKLMVAILAQAIIDAYMGSRSVKKKALSWFKSEDFKIVTNILRQNGVRPRNIFGIPCSWDAIPETSVERLYFKCKAIDYLEENANRYLLGTVDGKVLTKVSKRKKNYKGLQLANPSML